MQIVIDIDDNLYTRLFDNGDQTVPDMRRACAAIRKGMPVPKGHGTLIDAEYDFANWVAEEIFDENWEYNKDAFAELACRKLAKLGIVRAKGDEWELVEPQESEDEE